MNIFVLATTLFCNISTPQKVVYAPDWLAVPYEVTNITYQAEWPSEIDENADHVDPIREWAETNIVTRYRTVLNPSKADYLALGWKENRIGPAEHREGYRAAFDHYELDADGRAVVASYRYEEIVVTPEVMRFSKLKLGDNLEALGVYDIAEQWMVSNKVFRQWRDAQYFTSDYPVLIQATNLVIRSGMLTEEQMKKCLEESIDNE